MLFRPYHAYTGYEFLVLAAEMCCGLGRKMFIAGCMAAKFLRCPNSCMSARNLVRRSVTFSGVVKGAVASVADGKVGGSKQSPEAPSRCSRGGGVIFRKLRQTLRHQTFNTPRRSHYVVHDSRSFSDAHLGLSCIRASHVLITAAMPGSSAVYRRLG